MSEESLSSLDGLFTAEVYRAIHSVHKKYGLPARTRMLQLIDAHRSAKLAWESMAPDEMTSGLLDLAHADLLNLSLEYHMLKPAYSGLFSVQQRREAYDALREASRQVFADSPERIWNEPIDPETLLLVSPK